MRRVPGGYIYTVPVGFAFHCPMCPRGVTLRAGEECFVKNMDDSHVFCLRHAPILGKREEAVLEQEQEPEPEPARPRRGHRREAHDRLAW